MGNPRGISYTREEKKKICEEAVEYCRSNNTRLNTFCIEKGYGPKSVIRWLEEFDPQFLECGKYYKKGGAGWANRCRSRFVKVGNQEVSIPQAAVSIEYCGAVIRTEASGLEAVLKAIRAASLSG